jgi:hypothetical protein
MLSAKKMPKHPSASADGLLAAVKYMRLRVL